ncbi:unnamed protein product [Caretta caretta]
MMGKEVAARKELIEKEVAEVEFKEAADVQLSEEEEVANGEMASIMETIQLWENEREFVMLLKVMQCKRKSQELD